MKKIEVNYDGSFVKTTEALAIIIFVIGIIITIVLLIMSLGDSYTSEIPIPVIAGYVFCASLISFILIMSLSKILKQLLFIRLFNEIKASDLGFKFFDSCYQITNDYE